MKILNIGSKSIHVSSFLHRMKEMDQYLFVEESCGYLNNEKEFVFKIRGLNLFGIIFNFCKMIYTIKKLNPEIIHIHQLNRFAFFVCLFADKKIPIISTAWGSDVLIMPWKNKLFYSITKYLINRSSIVTADSTDMIESMMKIIPISSKYLKLQYGIQYVTPKKKQNIIYSNRLHKSLYRIDRIIEYFSEFVKNNQEWSLIVAGVGEDTDKLKEKAKNLGVFDKIQFVGWLDQSQNHYYYSIAKVYVTIPMSDGTSVSLLEAMSAGCIPIVSNLPVSNEWINHLRNGVIEYPNENPMYHIPKLNLEQIYKENREILDENNVSFEKSKQTFLKLYKSLL
jgi:glycosyltransferase involved in cell wall biosynthesis